MKLTVKQEEAQIILAGDATHIMLFGGSRSGKTALLVRNVIWRALKAPGSRHAILRFRFNHVKNSIILDTFPKIISLAFPGVKYHMDKTNWFVQFDNGSQILFGGLDDKERTEKILGMEFATIYLNECSQIPWGSVGIATTRLAQLVHQEIEGRTPTLLTPRIYYDCNPPNKLHWSYQLFKLHRDPDSKNPVRASLYADFKMNPQDNAENLSVGYLSTLQSLGARLRRRFLDGEFADAAPNALFQDEWFERWRNLDEELPDMLRIVIAVDPSGAGDVDNVDNDEIGIIVCGLGIDGNGYVLEDLTCKAGPATWGKVACDAFDRWEADRIVAEVNFGGAMVQHIIRTQRSNTPFRAVKASRGKVVRAEPISALVESGKVRMAGIFRELEDELCAFTTNGYMGENSPNHADAMVWGFADLFPELTKPEAPKPEPKQQFIHRGSGNNWMRN